MKRELSFPITGRVRVETENYRSTPRELARDICKDIENIVGMGIRNVRLQVDSDETDLHTSIDVRDDGKFAVTLINEESEGVWQGYLTQHEVTQRLMELNPTETLIIKFTPEKQP